MHPPSRATPFLFLLLIGATLLAFAVWKRLTDPYGVALIIEKADVPQADEALLRDVLTPLLQGSAFSGRYVINADPGEDHISFFLFDARKLAAIDRRFAQYDNNCAYTGWRNTILCDLGLFSRFVSDRRLDYELVPQEGAVPVDRILPIAPVDAQTLGNLRRGLMTWVIGHEIGHVIAGDGPSHFQKGKFMEFVEVGELSQQDELEADKFVVDQLNDPDGRDAKFYYGFLADVLNRDFRMRLCPDKDPLQYCDRIQQGAAIYFNTDIAMTYDPLGSHPEHLVRLLRMIDLVDDKYDMGLHGYFVKKIIEYLLNPKGQP